MIDADSVGDRPQLSRRLGQETGRNCVARSGAAASVEMWFFAEKRKHQRPIMSVMFNSSGFKR